MRDWVRRIGGGGLAAMAAVTLAAGAIGYRLWNERGVTARASALPSDPLAELQRRADAEPDNAGAWQALGLAQFESVRFAAAAEAYRRATAADPSSAMLWSSLGEALVMASARDPMPAQARAAFAKALELDPEDPRGRYFRAVEIDLSGDHRGAIDAWLALLADTPAGAPWEADLVRTIEQVGRINTIDVAARLAAAAARPARDPALPAMPGPSPDQLAAAAAIPPSEQQQMAEAMVARLAARLEREPGNVEGWIMLMRSYQTLGRDAQARRALQSALAANPGARARLTAAAATLRIA